MDVLSSCGLHLLTQKALLNLLSRHKEECKVGNIHHQKRNPNPVSEGRCIANPKNHLLDVLQLDFGHLR